MTLTSRRLALLALAGLAAFTVQAADPSRAPIVILISFDGLAAFNFKDPKVAIPTIRWMAEHGARAGGMESSFPSVTWPASRNARHLDWQDVYPHRRAHPENPPAQCDNVEGRVLTEILKR